MHFRVIESMLHVHVRVIVLTAHGALIQRLDKLTMCATDW